MVRGKHWSREELIIAMNLYCKIPFGQFDHRTPIIIEVAKKLSRTPSSLSMKLCNFASLDPIQKARGIKGLRGVSVADRSVWNEFHSNWEKLGIESEKLIQELLGDVTTSKLLLINGERGGRVKPSLRMPSEQPSGPTEKEMSIRVRRGQDFFRQTVLASYDFRCCITGNPVPELLTASHILPWSKYPKLRLNPRNGLCLARTHDAAFDRGLISFDKDYRLVLSKYLENYLPEETLRVNFVAYNGRSMRQPERFSPDPNFLRLHHNEIFRGKEMSRHVRRGHDDDGL